MASKFPAGFGLSRGEKLGTIYNRVTGLIKGQVVKYDNRPLWYDVMTALPPLDFPSMSRYSKDHAEKIVIKQLIWPEDHLRAQYCSAVKSLNLNPNDHSVTDLKDTMKTLADVYSDAYKQLTEANPDADSDQIMVAAFLAMENAGYNIGISEQGFNPAPQEVMDEEVSEESTSVHDQERPEAI